MLRLRLWWLFEQMERIIDACRVTEHANMNLHWTGLFCLPSERCHEECLSFSFHELMRLDYQGIFVALLAQATLEGWNMSRSRGNKSDYCGLEMIGLDHSACYHWHLTMKDCVKYKERVPLIRRELHISPFGSRHCNLTRAAVDRSYGEPPPT